MNGSDMHGLNIAPHIVDTGPALNNVYPGLQRFSTNFITHQGDLSSQSVSDFTNILMTGR